ncbi:leucine-rich repeat and IQ domain-containing protein 1-like isoform X2 [Lineus longissimus]|uniref:leucine-rich repeat and IQ domain-containing protein 1-like isoform X2 n=1 Tax=Lineus longissimus TaxID=88925 RepID=UPI002B4DF7FC
MDSETDIEDDSWLESEIQKELDAVNLNDADLKGGEEDEETKDVGDDNRDDDDDIVIGGKLPDDISPTMQDYLQRYQGQTSFVEQELLDCDTLISQMEQKIGAVNTSSPDDYLLNAAKEKGEDPVKMRKEILERLDQEDEEELLKAVKEADEEAATDDVEESAFMTETGDLVPSKPTETGESLAPSDGVMVVFTEADVLEREFHQQMQRWLNKQQKKELDRKSESDKRLEEFRIRIKESEEKRMQTLGKLDEEGKKLTEQRKAEEARFRQLADAQKQRFKQSFVNFEAQIEALSGEVQKEQELHSQLKREAEERIEQQRQKAAVKIQACFRRFRVLKEHGPTVRNWIAQRREEIMAEKLMKAEVSIRKRKEMEKIEEQAEQEKEGERILRQAAEKKAKEEEDRKRKAELEEKRLKEENEKKRLEEEKKAKEEEERQRKEAERLKMVEQKRLKEEDEKNKREEEKRRKEEEKKQKDEEKRRKAEEMKLKKEEEKLKKEEEKRKREEEKRLKEEEKRKAEEEKRAQEEEQRKRVEAEKLAQEEEMKKEAERLAKEAEEKRKEAEKKMEEIMQSEQTTALEKENNVKDPDKTELSNDIDEKILKERERKQEELKENERKKEELRRLAEEERKEKLATMKKKRDEMMEEPSAPAGPKLEELLQQKRLEWMQTCTPWSKISMEMKSRRTPVSKRPSRRPSSAKNLQNLPENVVLTAAEVKSLNDVTTVELCDLPGYNVTPLGGCQNLQHLSMTNCNLVTLDGLSACSSLAVLECQNNKIEMINLAKLESLLYVDLSNNNMTSIHGIDGCKNIRYLNLSKNRITRISSIGHCPQLHTLILSHNQLIRTQNLNEAPTIQVLDLSHNNLQALDDLSKMGMLRRLDASSNNILQFPSLTNQVLLEELLLDDNSIGSLGNLAACWLPLLHQLSINQNSLTSLEDVGGCLLLKELNIGNNQITDLNCVLKAFPSLPRLEHIWLNGNPFTELNKQFKTKVISELLSLQFIDGEKVPDRGNISQEKPSSYETMCLQQYQVNQGLWENYQKHVGSVVVDGSLVIIGLHQDYFDKSNKILTDHRYCHEYGEIKTDSLGILDQLNKQTVKTDFNHDSSRKDLKQTSRESDVVSVCSNSSRKSVDKSKLDLRSESGANLMDSKARFDALLGANTTVKTSDNSRKSPAQNGTEISHVDPRSKFEEALIGAGMAKNISNSVPKSQTRTSESNASFSDSKSKFDAMLQAQKPRSDRIGGNKASASTSQGVVQNALEKARLHNAATKIQALWRGYYLRKQIQNAYQYARMNGQEEDDMFGEEVDLSAFDMNEDDLDKDWMPSEVPVIPMNHAILKSANPSSDILPHPPAAPKHAWKDGQGWGKPPLPPSSAMSGQDTQRTWQSRKEEKISEEWGFKDSKTAELMMQRAKKLKYNALRKKKLSQLDPRQRLELMRKLEETNHMSPVQPPKKPAGNRKEYFKAKEDEVRHKEHERQEEMHNKKARMYEWLHEAGHPADDPSSSSCTPQPSNGNTALFRARHHGSDGNLPRLTPELIAGGRVMLTGSPSLELQSVDGSQAESEKIRRYSVGETHKAISQTQFPAIKINSAPTKKPEKMSWRGPEVNKSVGWGGGKKRPSHKI